MNEILSGAKVLKLYGWEKSFIGQILSIRHVAYIFISQTLGILGQTDLTVVHSLMQSQGGRGAAQDRLADGRNQLLLDQRAVPRRVGLVCDLRLPRGWPGTTQTLC